MTTVAVPAAIVPLRPAWRSLLWIVPLTVLWTWLIYALPVLPESGLPALAVRLVVHGLIALGLWLGLERTALSPGQRRTTWLAIMVPFTLWPLSPGQRRTTWLAIMVPFTLWAAVAWTAAINGVFRTGASPLPLLPSAIFLPVITGAPLLLLSKRVGQRSIMWAVFLGGCSNGNGRFDPPGGCVVAKKPARLLRDPAAWRERCGA
jgi:hypothetical protein